MPSVNYHADQARTLDEIGNNLRLAKGLSMLPDATIAAATALQDLIDYLATKEMGHADQQPSVQRVREALKTAKDLSYWSDAEVQAWTTIDSPIAQLPNPTATASIAYHE
jgi:hypothetical protein